VKPIVAGESHFRSVRGLAGVLGFGRASASGLIMAGLCLVAYVVLEWISYIHEYEGLPVTPWNPGLGVLFALMVVAGSVAGLVLLLGAVVAEILVLRSELEWPIVIGLGAIISVSYTSVAVVARRYLRLDEGLVHLRDVLALLGAGLAGAAINTILLTLFLIAFGPLDPLDMSDLIHASVPLLVGDLIGIAVITPLMLRFVFRRRSFAWRPLRQAAPEAAFYLVVIGVALWAIVGAEGAYDFRLFYLLFVPVMVAAVRHGFDGACLSLAAAQIGLIGLLHLSGYDAQVFTEFQSLMLVLTATGLIVGVVVSERENSERLVREAEARLKNRIAEAAQAARFNLVSGMASALAHEINQPMTAARALARSAQHILQAGDGDLGRADRNLATMIEQIDHAAGVVRRMRDFLRRGRPHVSTVDTRAMLEEALTLARADASARHVRLELDAPADLPPIHGDAIQLQQVLLNLIRNSVDAITGAGATDGQVRIVARRLEEPERVEIGVIDSGPGIDTELADRLFEPLITSKEEGLGLGLPISASIVEAHGGRIWVNSRAPGATEFRFFLPLDRKDES
jgi:two-component system sensor kinase FixL